MNYQQKYETLITIINNRLKDNMTVLAARHSLAGILAEAGETRDVHSKNHGYAEQGTCHSAQAAQSSE